MPDIKLTFKVFEDGYDIYREGDPLYEDGHAWISQREPNIPDKSLSYEENAKKQIEELSKAADTPVEADDADVVDEE